MMMILQVTEGKDLAVNSTATVSKKKGLYDFKVDYQNEFDKKSEGFGSELSKDLIKDIAY